VPLSLPPFETKTSSVHRLYRKKLIDVKITKFFIVLLFSASVIACGGSSTPVSTDASVGSADTIAETTAETLTDTGDNIPALAAALPSPSTEPVDINIREQTQTLVREKVNACEVTSLESLKDCIANASSYGGLDIKADLSCSGDGCCTGSSALIALDGISNFTIHGNSHLFTRTSGQRQCRLVDVRQANNLIIENWYLDDDVTVPPCHTSDRCPRMVNFRDSRNIVLDNFHVSNGKAYTVYTDGVEKFSFINSSISNSGVLGLYVGHTENFTSGVTISNSVFTDIQTNAIALLGVSGSETNVITNNMFLRNHWHGHWPVRAKFGTGTTPGGQLYIARAKNVLVEGNTILDGYCDNCYVSSGNRTGVHGIELGEPNKSSLSNVLIKNNTIGNNDAGGIYLNEGNQINSSIKIEDNVLINNRSSLSKISDNGGTVQNNDERSMDHFESFEDTTIPGGNFTVSRSCADNSTVEKNCKSETLFGECAVQLTLENTFCPNASISLQSNWFSLVSGKKITASGWQAKNTSGNSGAVSGNWCLEFSDANGEITGMSCSEIEAPQLRFSGLPSLDVQPPTGSTHVRWIATNNQSDTNMTIDDIKMSGVR